MMAKAFRPCAAPNCNGDAGKPGSGRGYCGKHYQRLKRYGSIDFVKMVRAQEGVTCKADGCSRPVSAKGLCTTHYSRLQKHGDWRDDALSDRPFRRVRWMEAHKDWGGGGCLIWPFSVGDNGRGVTTVDGMNTSAPRAMCLLANGRPPSLSHQAAHTCGNGHLGCVHPKHLRWATASENELDKVAHGTIRRGVKVNTNKLTEADVRYIRFSSKSGVSLAQRFGVTPSAISSIRTGKSWAWLK